MNDTIQALVEQFWTWLGITLDKLETVIQDEDIDITIQTPDSALIIGMHGKSLESCGHILRRIIEKNTGGFVHVHLEVNDYMKAKDERLFRFLDSKISLTLSTWKKVQLQNLNSYDRKKAHNYIAEKSIENLSTHSEWSGADRVLVIEYSGTPIWEKDPSPHKNTVTPNSTISLSEEGIGI